MRSTGIPSRKSSCNCAINFSKAMKQSSNVFVRILVPFCAGIWVLRVAHFTKLNLLLYISALSSLFLIFIFNYLYTSLKVYHHKQNIAILLYLFFFSIGGLSSLSHQELKYSNHFSRYKAEYFKIYIADEPQEKGGIIRFKARVTCAYEGIKKTRTAGLLMIALRLESSGSPVLNYGDVYLIPARYTSIPSPLNPGEFDSPEWLANQSIYHQAYLSSEELIPLKEQHGLPLIRFAIALRKLQVERYRKLIRDDDAFALAATLILGYRAALDTEILSAYSQTGTIHALSVSGMHVGIIYLILEAALSWMNRRTVLKWTKVILILTLIWFYTLLTGYPASALRSAIMLTMLILSKSLHRNTSSNHILAFSAFCLLRYDPFLLWDVGFQLSYMAVLGLVDLQPGIRRLLSFKSYWVQKGWEMISLSIAAQIFTFPFSIYYFHQFPVYFLLSNLFIALPVIALMYAGLAILIFHLYWLAVPFEWLITFMNSGLARIARLPYSTVQQIWLTKPELCLLCMLMIAILTGLQNKKKLYLFAALFILMLLQGLLAQEKITAQRQKKIILFSLNRNYAVAFILAEKAVLVTDLRPNNQAFKFHIQPALDQLRISSVICIPWNTRRKEREGYGLVIRDHQIRFRQFSILMVDSFFDHRRIRNRSLFDAIWIHGNPRVKVSELRKDIRFQKIWIDGTNYSDIVNKIQTDTLYFKSSTIVLKKITASLINLNQYKPIQN